MCRSTSTGSGILPPSGSTVVRPTIDLRPGGLRGRVRFRGLGACSSRAIRGVRWSRRTMSDPRSAALHAARIAPDRSLVDNSSQSEPEQVTQGTRVVAECELPVDGQVCAVVARGRCSRCNRAICATHTAIGSTDSFQRYYRDDCTDCEAEQRSALLREIEQERTEKTRIMHHAGQLSLVVGALVAAGAPGSRPFRDRREVKNWRGKPVLTDVEIRAWDVGSYDWRCRNLHNFWTDRVPTAVTDDGRIRATAWPGPDSQPVEIASDVIKVKIVEQLAGLARQNGVALPFME